MTTRGIPNDLLANFNPVALIILIPLMDVVVYPGLRRAGIVMQPIFRIWLGFMFASLAMVYSAILQYNIYRTNPCGEFVGTCSEPSTISIWAQVPCYVSNPPLCAVTVAQFLGVGPYCGCRDIRLYHFSRILVQHGAKADEISCHEYIPIIVRRWKCKPIPYASLHPVSRYSFFSRFLS